MGMENFSRLHPARRWEAEKAGLQGGPPGPAAAFHLRGQEPELTGACPLPPKKMLQCIDAITTFIMNAYIASIEEPL